METSLMPHVLPRASPHKPCIAVIGHLADAHLYGAERSLLSILAAIDRDHYDLCAFVPGYDAQYMRAIGRYTDAIEVFPYSWWGRTRLSDAAAVLRFAELFQSRCVDLVHVNTITLMDPLLAARRR